MLIRPPQQLGTDYSAIKRKIDADYSANQAIWQIYWTESTIDTRLEAGDTSLMADVNANLPNNNRGQYYFNRVRPLLSSASGHQRRNRKSSVIVPLERGDQHTADQWTKIILNLFKREHIYDTLSDAFHQGALMTGMNMLQVYLDWQSDPINGDIKVDNVSYNSFFVDPYFRKLDLSDAAFVWRRSYMSHSQAAASMPEHYEQIMALPGNPTGTGRDGRFQYMPESYGQTQQNRLAYDEYYYRDYRMQTLLVDKITGEVMEVKNPDEIDLDLFLQTNPSVSLIKQDVPTVRLAILIQDKVFYDGPNPLGIDNYPFVPVVGYYNPMMPYFYSRIQGLCRSLRDPQMLLNRRIILSADLLESQTNSGWIFKENAPIDVKHLFQTGQGRVIPIKQDANITDIVPIQPPQIPPSFFQLQETFSKELSLVSGVNEELMGFNYDDKSGYRSALQQNAGLTTLEPLFDKLDSSQMLLTERMMEIIQANYTPGKIRNILEGDEPAPLFYNKAFGKYHAQVQLGLNTQSQRQMQFAQYMQLREIGVQVPDEDMIEVATIQNKEDLTKKIAARQQAQEQQAQQQAQVAMQEQSAKTQLYQARAIADQGLGYERMSRIEENKALAEERRAAAVKDDYQSLLNAVKVLKEIESVDIDSLHKVISLQGMLKTFEEQPQPKQKGSVSGS